MSHSSIKRDLLYLKGYFGGPPKELLAKNLVYLSRVCSLSLKDFLPLTSQGQKCSFLWCLVNGAVRILLTRSTSVLKTGYKHSISTSFEVDNLVNLILYLPSCLGMNQMEIDLAVPCSLFYLRAGSPALHVSSSVPIDGSIELQPDRGPVHPSSKKKTQTWCRLWTQNTHAHPLCLSGLHSPLSHKHTPACKNSIHLKTARNGTWNTRQNNCFASVSRWPE